VAFKITYDSGVAAAEAAMRAAAAAPAERKQVSGLVPMLVNIDRERDQVYAARSASGVTVTDRSALHLSTFFGCTRLLSSTIGSLPAGLFKPDASGYPTAARELPLYRVLHDSPNADQTPIDYFELLTLSLIMAGDHFALKTLDRNGETIALDPVRPDIVTVYRRDDGEIAYRWTADGEEFDLTQRDVFHVRGFGGGPLRGMSIVANARESLGIALAADRAAASMFANGARPSGALKFKDWLDADKRKDARNDINAQFAGAVNTGRPFILEGDSEWQQISINADDAQLLESRAWSVEEICRWFGVPPFMIGHSEKSTSWGTGIEQQLLGFQKFTLNPYLRRIEQAISKQLLTAQQRAQGVYAKFNIEGLLRADSMARANFYRAMTQTGVMTINECRAKEDLPPIEGGDVARIQAQNVPVDQADGLALPPAAQE
jgi:HK97 family phage portal protein